MDVRITGTAAEITEALARLRAGTIDGGGGRGGAGYGGDGGHGDRDSGKGAFPVCIPKRLPAHQRLAAARRAIQINPVNRPAVERIAGIAGVAAALGPQHKEFLAAVTTKYWGPEGVRLTVGFLDSPPADLRNRIMSHLNAWNETANVEFVETRTDPEVRIARLEGDGYWSYVGTDILERPREEPTMNLDSFTMETPDEEFHRVVRHEAGHTLGFPHEHMREELVKKIDEQKAIAYFRRTQGWTEAEVRQQVLTSLEEDSILGTDRADQTSIMCYQIPGDITRDGQPILGGLDINETDREFVALLYPRPEAEPAKAIGRYMRHTTARARK